MFFVNIIAQGDKTTQNMFLGEGDKGMRHNAAGGYCLSSFRPKTGCINSILYRHHRKFTYYQQNLTQYSEI